MARYPILCTFAFLAFGCGAQNVSSVTLTFKADRVLFSEIVKDSVLINGLDHSRVHSLTINTGVGNRASFSLFGLDTLYGLTASFSDAVGDSDHQRDLSSDRKQVASLFGVEADSLNVRCVQELQEQLAARFPKLSVIHESRMPSLVSVPHELRIRNASIGDRTDNVYGTIIDKKVFIFDVEMLNRRNGVVLFRLRSKGEVISSRYAHPWNEAVRLAVARVVDYIGSNGEDYSIP